MKSKIISILVILLLVFIIIPIVSGESTPVEIPKDRLLVVGKCNYVSIQDGLVPKGNTFVTRGEYVDVSHHGEGILLIISIDGEYGHITTKIFRHNTNIISFKSFEGLIVRHYPFVFMSGLHTNMKITTW